MNELAFNLDFFLRFELPNLLILIKIGFYAFFTVHFLYRMHFRKNEGDPYRFEIFISLFFLFMCLGTIWEGFCLVFDPIFFHSGIYYFYDLTLIPVGFTGKTLVYCFGYIGLGFLSLGVELGSNLPSKGIISVVPFSFAAGMFIWGQTVLTLPWFLFSLIAAIVPVLFFYIAFKGDGAVRNKALLLAIGFLGIFAGEALNYNLWIQNFPDAVGVIINLLQFPINFLLPLGCVVGCILILISQIIYRD